MLGKEPQACSGDGHTAVHVRFILGDTCGHTQDKAVPPRLGYFQKTVHFLKQECVNCVFLDTQDLQYR